MAVVRLNKRQKEILQTFLDDEKEVLALIKQNYHDALNEVNIRIDQLMNRDDADLSNVVYQISYQKALQSQISGIMSDLHGKEFNTISEYLVKSYENGYIGSMYDIHGQGIPIIVPIDQKNVVRAITHDTKLSSDLYTSLGKDINKLSRQISAEISRGFSTAMTYTDITRNISDKAKIPQNRAMTIARTEAHRIQSESSLDAQRAAVKAGADVKKQWDAFLDGLTREAHQRLDGQIRDIEEPFEVDGHEAMFPGGFGVAELDINCRCALLQRASWALDQAELDALKERAAFFGLDKSKDFEEFKEKYKITVNNVTESADQEKKTSIIDTGMTSTEIDAAGREMLLNHWDEYRDKFLGNATVITDDLIKNPLFDTVHLGKYKEKETVSRIFDQIDKLSSKFYSPLYRLEWMNRQESMLSTAYASVRHNWGAGSATMKFNPVKLTEDRIGRIYDMAQSGWSAKFTKGNEIEYLVTHEFGHCILNSGDKLPTKKYNFAETDLVTVKKARKEIDSIWGAYTNDVKVLTDNFDSLRKPIESKMIFEGIAPTDEEKHIIDEASRALDSVKISRYSLSCEDEFIAEAFADAVMNESPSDYSRQVYGVLEKYFGK